MGKNKLIELHDEIEMAQRRLNEWLDENPSAPLQHWLGELVTRLMRAHTIVEDDLMRRESRNGHRAVQRTLTGLEQPLPGTE